MIPYPTERKTLKNPITLLKFQQLCKVELFSPLHGWAIEIGNFSNLLKFLELVSVRDETQTSSL